MAALAAEEPTETQRLTSTGCGRPTDRVATGRPPSKAEGGAGPRVRSEGRDGEMEAAGVSPGGWSLARRLRGVRRLGSGGSGAGSREGESGVCVGVLGRRLKVEVGLRSRGS